MRKLALPAAIASAALASPAAHVWFQGFFGGGWSHGDDFGGWNHSSSLGAGGFSHFSDFGGWDHSTQVTAGGVSHESNYGGAWHGTAADSQGVYHASDYGGYYHGTAVGPNGAVHTGYNGTTTTAYGAYYHQPATVNYYGTNCYNCGSGWGAAAADTAVGVAAGAALGATAAAAAAPAYYAVLPAGCFYQAAYREYQCGNTWMPPSYDAPQVRLPRPPLWPNERVWMGKCSAGLAWRVGLGR